MSQHLPTELLYDKRLQDRFVRLGLLSRKQVQDWLGGLDDLATQADQTDLVKLQEEHQQRRHRAVESI